MCVMTGDDSLVFPGKLLLSSLFNVIVQWKIVFQKSKRPQRHSLMSFNSF